VHTLRVTPRAQLETSELTPDDGEDNPEAPRVAYSTQPIGRTPGWTLSVGTREFMRVLEIGSYTPAHGEPQSDTRVDFLWRWRPRSASVAASPERSRRKTPMSSFASRPHSRGRSSPTSRGC